MPNKILGIDLSPKAIKVVELEEQDGKFAPLKWSIDYFPAPEEDNPAKILSAALKKNDIHTKQVIVALSTPELTYHLIELPAMPEHELASAIKYKLSSLLSFPVEEAVVAYQAIEGLSHEHKKLFFVSALPKKSMADVLNVLKKAGLSPRDVFPSACALANMAAQVDLDTFALVYIGDSFSLIGIMKQGGQIIFAREIEVGVGKLTEAMVGVVVTPTGKIDVDYSRAQDLISKFGIPLNLGEYSTLSGLPAEEIMARIRPVFEEIEIEIFRTSEYYNEKTEAHAEFNRIYLSGEGILVKNLVEYFKGLSFGSQVEVLPLDTGNAPKEFVEAAPRLVKALGAAASAKCRLSLLDEKYKGGFKARFKNIFNYFSVGIVYLIILGLVSGFWFYRGRQINSKLIMARQQLTQQTAALQKSKETALAFELAKKIGGNLGASDRFVGVMDSLQKITPEDIDLQELAYNKTADELIITGIVLKSRGYGRISEYIELLKKDALFKSIDLVFVEESDRFTVPVFDFKLKCILVKG